MRLAKSIDELYEEVKEYDIVLCNDAPLALALNNRIDTPRIGTFAITPKQLAGDVTLDLFKKGTIDDIKLVKSIADITGYNIRYVHSEIENIKTMRKYTSDIRNHLGKKAQNVYDEYIQFETLDRIMEKFDGESADCFKNKKIAVIGGELYNDLDKHFNPKFGTYEEINPFKRGKYSIKEFRELSNDRQMAENAISMINKENATDVAIVMDVGGKIADAVRSALYRNKIPFKNTVNVKDLNNIRDFLEFVGMSLTFDTVKVKQIRELISAYGGFIPSKYDEYLVQQYANITDNENTIRLLGIMGNIRNMSFIDVCENVVKGKEKAQVKILLDEMGLVEKLVNEDDTDDIVYAVNNINDLKHNEQIPDNEKEGVLLVDCQNAVYIDRPIVIFLGIGSEWEKDLSDLNLIDYRLKDDENEKNVIKFQILLQQGTVRLYLCNSIKNGKKPKPCAMFDQCSDKTASSFADVCDELISGPWYRPEPVTTTCYESSYVDNSDYIPKPFSKSSYNNFVSCPREYLYSRLLGSPDKSSTVVGNILHEYAEFRVCYPELVKKHDVDYYADIISKECTGLFTPEVRSMEHSSIRNSICNINKFVEVMGFDEKITLGIKKNNTKPNRFFAAEGVEEGSPMAEIRVMSSASHMEGIFDIMLGNNVYDFKTGEPTKVKKIREDMNLNEISEYNKEFQCMFYLSLLDEKSSDKNICFSQFYTTDNDSKSAHGIDFDIRSNMRHVALIDTKEDFFKDIYFDKLTRVASYQFLENCRDVFISAVLEFGLDDSNALISNTTIPDMISNHLNKGKTCRDSVKKALKKISDNVCEKEMLLDEDTNTLYVTKKSLDDFRNKVWKDYEKAKEYYSKEYPAMPLIKCKNCYFQDLCTAEPLVGGESDV